MSRIKSYLKFWSSISSFSLISESSISLFFRCSIVLFRNKILGKTVFKWVNDSKLKIERFDSGLRTNLFIGFSELEMLFMAKVCVQGEDFIDIGANSGQYSVLLAKVCNLKCYAFEPSTEAYKRLTSNINLNNISNLVLTKQIAVGASNGIGFLTKSLSLDNYIITEDQKNLIETESINIMKLDDLYTPENRNFFLKVDVEGFEGDVLKGGHQVFSHPNLLGIIMETNGSGCKYGNSDEKIAKILKDTYSLNPYKLSYSNNQFIIERGVNIGVNTLFTSNIDLLKERLIQKTTIFSHPLNRYL